LFGVHQFDSDVLCLCAVLDGFRGRMVLRAYGEGYVNAHGEEKSQGNPSPGGAHTWALGKDRSGHRPAEHTMGDDAIGISLPRSRAVRLVARPHPKQLRFTSFGD